ncbi:FAD binding domain-containing protein [Colletotrichum tofieldiae]|nr:FAD binding domain-containing protein [Colletotrichum tofieldiae]GKT78634.1 FAD binding domain-containing protein [Colletotrichum tofieldiae]
MSSLSVFETMLEITKPPCPASEHLQHRIDYSKHHLSPCSAPNKEIPHDVPVLIVGGGPTGLLTAYMLSRHGVRSLLVEKYSERLPAPKAHALCPRTLEICRQYGLETNAIRRMGSPRRDACRVNFLMNLGVEAIGSLPYERMDVGVLEHTPQNKERAYATVSTAIGENILIKILSGLSLNSGIANAHNLAYKIAAIHWGRTGPGLLGTYKPERRQVAVVAAAQNIKNGKSVFSFLKAVGAGGQGEDLVGARRQMYKTIRNPARQALIAENVKRQREHFDNIELHIGYVYGDEKPPTSTSTYTPKFRNGARLPHAWIKIQRPCHGLPQQPIDLSYIKELSNEQVAAQQFSTLDLVRPGTFNLIAGHRSAWARRFKESAEVLGYGISLCLWAADKDFVFCSKGHRRLYKQDGHLSRGAAIIVRPDQHILKCLGPETSVTEIVDCVKRYLDVK